MVGLILLQWVLMVTELGNAFELTKRHPKVKLQNWVRDMKVVFHKMLQRIDFFKTFLPGYSLRFHLSFHLSRHHL